MTLRVLVVAVLALGSGTSVVAQSKTADALVALTLGDYNAAAAILKPVADSDNSADSAAQFLMATLYESGRGVPMDKLHACALYHRASMNSEAPFGSQAERLTRMMFRAHGAAWFANCQALANLGFDHRFEPVTFDLAPGHAVAWDFNGATVTYQGQAKPFPMRIAGRGAAYLPLLQTTLRSTGPSLFPRYFIEVFIWQGMEGQWALNWHLFEVVRDELVIVIDEPALLKRGSRPSASEVLDLRTLVRLRANDAALAEWQILAPGRERSGTIPRR